MQNNQKGFLNTVYIHVGLIHFSTHTCILNYHILYRVFQKSSPAKTFWNIFTSVKSFCVKRCKFFGSLYPHMSANVCTFILIFHQMALIIPRVPVVWVGLFTKKINMQLFGNDVIFPHRVYQYPIIVNNR